MGSVDPAELGGDRRSPVAPLGPVAVVAEPGHQLGPRRRRPCHAPAGRRRFAAEPEAGQRRAHHVEGVGGVAPVGLRIGEGPDDLLELHHRAGPSMGDHQGQGARMRGTDVQEVDVEAVDGRDELGVSVEPGLGGPPVVLLGPVGAQRSGIGEGKALTPVVDGLRLGPPGATEPVPEVGQLPVGDVDAERSKLGGHGVNVGSGGRGRRGDTAKRTAGPRSDKRPAWSLASRGSPSTDGTGEGERR